ncbi:MAG TPA: hypothetical protein VFA26_22880, partial [Gemmataceae bacterium]|nr:hypothetical protein [Gemmataceae bacterium]
YPDALVLDLLIKFYLALIERRPDLFAADNRLRRRALRQAWLLRRRYEGHPVPDAPTSPGENARVLPPPFARVPEDQILYPHRRNCRLYDGDPLDRHLGESGRAVLRQSIEDLRHPAELRELGLAVFLDRPLGAGKAPTEPDGTLLLSYLAFSRAVARQRLRFLAERLKLLPEEEHAALRRSLDGLEVAGLPLDAVVGSPRPGSVCLLDARKAADDFVFLRLTDRAAGDFLRQYGLGELMRRFKLPNMARAPILIVRSNSPEGPPRVGLSLYDGRLRKRVEMDFDPRMGYASRGGVEYPLSPLRVLRVWEGSEGSDELRERDLHGELILLPPPEPRPG